MPKVPSENEAVFSNEIGKQPNLSSEWLLPVVACLRSAVVGNQKNEAYFVVADGACHFFRAFTSSQHNRWLLLQTSEGICLKSMQCTFWSGMFDFLTFTSVSLSPPPCIGGGGYWIFQVSPSHFCKCVGGWTFLKMCVRGFGAFLGLQPRPSPKFSSL